MRRLSHPPPPAPLRPLPCARSPAPAPLRPRQVCAGAANPVSCAVFRVLLEEYGGGRLGRKHSNFYRGMMEEMGLDTREGGGVGWGGVGWGGVGRGGVGPARP
jgi:hypothetical protein